jgi:hypothetical protein
LTKTFLVAPAARARQNAGVLTFAGLDIQFHAAASTIFHADRRVPPIFRLPLFKRAGCAYAVRS